MSQYSPTVIPTWGESLANALGQGVNSYLATRRQKRADDWQMLEAGYQPETDEERAIREGTKSAPIPTQGQTNAHLAAQVQGSGTDPYTPQQLAESLGQPQMNTGAVIGGQHVRMTDMKQAQLAAALAMQRAQMNRDNATAYKDTREGGQARPGDANYASVMGSVKGAEVNAETPGLVNRERQMAPIRTQQAVDIGRAMLPIKVQEAGGAAQAELPSKLALQGNQQGFERDKQMREIAARAEQERQRQSGELGNRLTEIDYGQQGSLTGRASRHLFGPPVANSPRAPLGQKKTGNVYVDTP